MMDQSGSEDIFYSDDELSDKELFDEVRSSDSVIFVG